MKLPSLFDSVSTLHFDFVCPLGFGSGKQWSFESDKLDSLYLPADALELLKSALLLPISNEGTITLRGMFVISRVHFFSS